MYLTPNRSAARAALLIGSLLALLTATQAAAFDFDDVAAIARRLGRAPYKAPDPTQPAELEGLNYDEYRDIRFNPDRALWRDQDLPFDVMFFHRGKDNKRVRM